MPLSSKGWADVVGECRRSVGAVAGTVDAAVAVSEDTVGSVGKTRVPAIEGWFTLDETVPALLGSRCTSCGTFSFPAQTSWCTNPACSGTGAESVELSRRGTVWSYTDARYQPPPPYRAADPYVPFALAAVELSAEKMVVMGQMVAGVGVDDLTVGDEVQLVLDILYEDDEHEYLVWKWQPVGAGGGGDGVGGGGDGVGGGGGGVGGGSEVTS